MLQYVLPKGLWHGIWRRVGILRPSVVRHILDFPSNVHRPQKIAESVRFGSTCFFRERFPARRVFGRGSGYDTGSLSGKKSAP